MCLILHNNYFAAIQQGHSSLMMLCRVRKTGQGQDQQVSFTA